MWNWLLFDIKTSNFPSENDQSSYKSKNTLASIFFQSQKKKIVKIFILIVREAQKSSPTYAVHVCQGSSRVHELSSLQISS